MNNQEQRLRDLFSRDVEIPEAMEDRLSRTYADIRRQCRGKEESSMKHLKRRGIKTALLIAAAVALLSVTAAAVYQYRLEDAEMSVIDISSPEETPEEPVYESRLSYNGFQDSPEYQAYVEWANWNRVWQAENPGWFREWGLDDGEYEGPENYVSCYGAYAQEQVDKLNEIMDKYGLAPHTDRIGFSTAGQLCRALGLDGLFGDGIDIQGEYLYDDGSFKAVGNADIDGEEIWIDVFHAVRGSFSVIESNMPEEYEQWSYATASGVEVLLALSPEGTYMVAGLEGSYVIAAFAVTEPEQAQALADSIDLAALNGLFATEAGRRAVSASIAAFQEERRTAKATDNAGEGADIVLSILGNYYLAERPEGSYLWATSCGLPDAAGGDGCYSVVHSYDGKPAGVTLGYRTLREGETALEFSSPEEQDRLGIKETACTVNGYGGIVTEYNQGTESAMYSVKWLDTDRELVFSVGSSGFYDLEEMLAYARSVTAEDPDLETGSAAYAGRAARYQDEIDARTAQSWAEYEAYQAEEDAAVQAAREKLGDYGVTALPADAAMADCLTNSVRDVSDWYTGERYGYGLDVRKSYACGSLGGNVNLAYERYWSREDESVLVNERYFGYLQRRFGTDGEINETYTGGLSVNGYEAFMVESFTSTAGSSIVDNFQELYWNDTDSGLIFDLTYIYTDEADALTAQELIALAESVRPAEEGQ